MRIPLALCLVAAMAMLAPGPAALAGSGAGARAGHHAKAKAKAKPDFAAARAHYRKGEQAAAAGQWKQAAAEYQAAYEITKDPVLFFKIATAHDRGGNCGLAVGYYRRYLRDGKPNKAFATLTKKRIARCQQRLGKSAGKAGSTAAGTASKPPAQGGTKPPQKAAAGAQPAGGGAAAKASRTSEKVPAGAATHPGKNGAAESAAHAGAHTPPPGHPAASGAPHHTPAGAAIGSEEPPHRAPAPSFSQQPSWKRSAAWTATGLAIAFAATGAVLALSASARENDINSLINFRDPTSGMAPTFDGAVRTRYEDLVNQGHNLELASRLTLAAAGVAASAAVTFFLLDEHSSSSSPGAAPMAIAPIATGKTFGLAAGWEF